MAQAYFFLFLLIPLSLLLLLLLYFIVRLSPSPSQSRTATFHHRRLQRDRPSTSPALIARNVSKLEEAKQSIKLATGCDVKIVSADVGDYDAIRRAVDEAGAIDVLMCNHGVYVPQELENQELDEIKFMIDVNLTGTFHLIKAALPGMKRNRAEIRARFDLYYVFSGGTGSTIDF